MTDAEREAIIERRTAERVAQGKPVKASPSLTAAAEAIWRAHDAADKDDTAAA